MKESEQLSAEDYRKIFDYTLVLRDRYLYSKDEAKDFVLFKAHNMNIFKNKGILDTFETAWKSKKKEFVLTEIGNSERFVAQHGKDVLYCHKKGLWYTWDGKKWNEDQTNEVMRLAKETVRSIKTDAENMPDGSAIQEALLKFWKSSEKMTQYKAMIKAATLEKKIVVLPEDLDSDKWYLNCTNGVVDLKNGQKWNHLRDDLITMTTGIRYTNRIKCPRWMDFIDDVCGGSPNLKSFLQRCVGYSLTGVTAEKCLFFLLGPSNTGKTVFVETIREMMGDYARGTDFQTFLSTRNKSAIRNDLARLEKARFVSACEAGQDQIFDEPTIKLVTGGDTIIARFLYKEFFEFETEFKIFLASNFRPKVQGGDDAIWNRLLVIPFDNVIPESEQDKNLREKFKREMPGILYWAVQGCLKYQEQGLNPPPIVRKAVKQYRSEADMVQAFINEKCRIAKDQFTRFSDLYRAWEVWCKVKEVPLTSESHFARDLLRKGFISEHRYIDKKLCRVRMGLILS